MGTRPTRTTFMQVNNNSSRLAL
ncbi:uncharacterized protein G2W53_014199 [Senna tora]|uniref:Uncharacterized protein n=1 Tax=Senna tora TaxID=362788 RepID=A0A835C291_9FABA|nr:uncharacterized protein G2W53_014199 [Senna tora]